MKQWKGYYALLATAVGGALGSVLYMATVLFGGSAIVNSVSVVQYSFITGLGIALTFAGTAVFDMLPNTTSRKIKWMLRQPFIWQLVIFIFVAMAAISVMAILRQAIANNSLVASFDIAFNLSYTLFGFYFLYWLLRALFGR
ncbi:MAG TPA: hypothetical protein VLA88_05690 [Candidatus Saccharimonadales bacterium]|nr:hypothetical protein [Candidatus Saccharimonadales bacterium]